MSNSEKSIILMPKYSLELEFNLQPEAGRGWEKTGSVTCGNGGEESLYKSGEYIVKIMRSKDHGNTIIDFSLKRQDSREFTLVNYTVKCLVPVVDMHNVSPMFVGYAHVNHKNEPTFLASCTSKDSPYVMYGSRSGENRFTIGLENQFIETSVTRHGKGGYMYYDTNLIKFIRPVNGVKLRRSEIRDAVFVSDCRKNWFHITRDYWDWIDKRRGYVPNHVPASAYGPVWCSWLYLTDIDEEKIWKNAKAAKELGIKTIIIDAGWYCSDTDIPFSESPLNRDTLGFGRINADLDKFPDMKGLVDRIHNELGLYVWAWATPRWVFHAVEEGDGRVDPELLDCRIVTEKGEKVPLLCTRNRRSREHAALFTSELLRKYGFDGLKFDCWEMDGDMGVCTSDHEHDFDTMGEGTIEWATGIYNAMVEENPEAVVWLSNTVIKPFSNYSVSPNEVYCHPDENWRMSVLLKTFTRGIVSQLCEGSWHRDEPDRNLARQMAILMMGHTPEVQVDLTRLRESHKKILKAWLEFYEEHKYDLHWGEYEPFGFENMLGGPISTTPPNVRIEGEKDAYIWMGTVFMEKVSLQKHHDKVYVFNLKNVDGLKLKVCGLLPGRKKITVFNCYLNVVEENTIETTGDFPVDVNVAAGGMLCVEHGGEEK